MGLNTTPRTWTTSELVTAAMMNTEVRDAFTGVQAAWTSYSPSWTAATTNPTIGNGTIVGAYLQIGKTVHWRIKISPGSTTTFGTGTYFVSLPVTPISSPSILPIGNAFLQDTGVNSYILNALYVGDAGGTRFYTSASPAATWQPATPATFGNGDFFSAAGMYEVP